MTPENEAAERLECTVCGAPVVDDHGPRYDPSAERLATVERIRAAVVELNVWGDEVEEAVLAILDAEAAL